MNLDLLKNLCTVYSPSGDEGNMKDFLISYVLKNKGQWPVQPEIIQDESVQDCLGLVFGKPRTAVFIHIDTIAFMVRYQDQLVPVGSPEVESNTILIGSDKRGRIETKIRIDEENRIYYQFMRGIETGTYLTYKPCFQYNDHSIQSPYLDNRIGIWNALSLAQVLRNGIIFFTCGEENGGGSAGYLAKLMYERFNVKNALISDVTWASDGIRPGNGVVISLKDRYIPRRSYLNTIINIARYQHVKFQLEVEDDGSSDGGEIQKSPYPINWCFIGPAGYRIHSAREKIYIEDVRGMNDLYQALLDEL